MSSGQDLQAELDAAGERYRQRVQEALRAGERKEQVPYEVVAVSGATVTMPLKVPHGVSLTGPQPLIGGSGYIADPLTSTAHVAGPTT